MIELSWERHYRKFFAEAEFLIDEHWAEASTFGNKFPLEIDHNLYVALEHMSRLKILIARRDNRMVGYLFLITGPYPRNPALVIAQDDIFYTIPSERNSLLGYKMLKEVVRFSRAVRYDILTLRRKPGRTGEKLMARLGLRPVATVYGAFLE